MPAWLFATIPALGWLLCDGCEGQGYATEAAARPRDWAFREGGLATPVSYIHPANARSLAVAERLGGRRDDTAPRAHPAVIVYRYTPQNRAVLPRARNPVGLRRSSR